MTTLETLEAIDDLAERYGVPADQWCAFKGDVLELVVSAPPKIVQRTLLDDEAA
jgi:hypothetical protein